jgi:iron complex transport system permease protein
LQVFYQLRLPRSVLSFLCGAVLALGGVVFQALFRNPLASPYTLGVSAGAAFGASVAIVLGIASYSSSWILLVAALTGGICSSGIVLLVPSKNQIRTDTLLLAGVVITFFFGSISLFLQYIADYSKVFALSRWMMGSVGVVGWTELLWLTPLVLCGAVLLFRQAGSYDLLAFGDEFSHARGVDPARITRHSVLIVSILIAAVVAICGPIGFVGVIIPHSVRLLGYRKHVTLLPLACVYGGCFLLLADALGRSIAYPYELPVGVITALTGSPMFLYLLLRTRSIGS